ncbi:MAG TPA: hypothetical protein VGM69_00900 [Chloroflexota bacterium]|jgi:hypothetical protein
MIIEQRACPRCALPRTARTADRRRICFNCRRVWPREETPEPAGTSRRPADPPSGESVDDVAFPFSARERARLLVYRAAVRAGLFNEGPTGEGGPIG